MPKKQSSRFAILMGVLIVAAAALFVLAIPALAAQYFRFYKIVFPNASVTQPLGINNEGLIVGVTNGEGFLLQNGKFTVIAVPDSDTAAFGINKSGQIVGYYDANGGTQNPQGFLYNAGTFTTINVPGALLTEPNGINDSGTIVGQYRDQSRNSGNDQGFIYSAGTFTALDFPGAVSTGAEKINNSGQIVGYYTDSSNNTHAFIYTDGAFQDLFGSACKNSVAFGINNLGYIVGSCNSQAFLYNYASHNYIFFAYPGAMPVPFAINDSGRVVGDYQVAFNAYNGFLAVPLQ